MSEALYEAVLVHGLGTHSMQTLFTRENMDLFTEPDGERIWRVIGRNGVSDAEVHRELLINAQSSPLHEHILASLARFSPVGWLEVIESGMGWCVTEDHILDATSPWELLDEPLDWREVCCINIETVLEVACDVFEPAKPHVGRHFMITLSIDTGEKQVPLTVPCVSRFETTLRAILPLTDRAGLKFSWTDASGDGAVCFGSNPEALADTLRSLSRGEETALAEINLKWAAEVIRSASKGP